MQKMKTIAAFDFDGTIIRTDSLKEYVIYSWGLKRFSMGLLILSPILLLWKLRIISNHMAKEQLFSYFFKSMSADEFNDNCRKFSKVISESLRSEIFAKLNWHRGKGHKIVIISASIDNWIRPWATEHNIDEVIATEIEIKNKALTGKFKTRNCSGKEKVSRFLERYPNRDEYYLYFYGDSRGDREMLKLADKAFLKVAD